MSKFNKSSIFDNSPLLQPTIKTARESINQLKKNQNDLNPWELTCDCSYRDSELVYKLQR